PALAAGGPKNRPLRVGRHQPPGQLLHRRREVDDAGLAGLAHRLVPGEYPGGAVAGHIVGRDRQDLPGPAAGVEQGEDELSELLVADRLQDVFTLLGREHALAAATGRDLNAPERVVGE